MDIAGEMVISQGKFIYSTGFVEVINMDQAYIEQLFKPVYDRVVVTGGGSNLGRGIALALAALGISIYIMGRRKEPLEETVQLSEGSSGSIIPVICDIRDPVSVDQAFSTVAFDGPVQSLVHAAGEVRPAMAKDCPLDVFQESLDSQLAGTFIVVQRWARSLIETKLDGVGITFSSALCSRETPGLAHSSAANAGIESMIRSMASEWGRYGIRLNTIGPGFFPSPWKGGTLDWLWDGDWWEKNKKTVPLRRIGKNEEIVGPAVFLLSKAASYITGETIVVDGGLRLRQLND
jgi:NAD(P)-dependent dehydrogenase (short-subunit alcohol dehydrogenase family)